MREDVSFIDDALRFTATLNTSQIGPGSLSSESKPDGKWTSSRSVDPAESLLARGSAADLKIVQGGASGSADLDSIQPAQPSQNIDNRSLKRKVSQVITSERPETGGQNGFQSRGLQQRLPSRHMMPPPPGPVSNNGFIDTPGQSPTRDHHFYGQVRTLESKQNLQHPWMYEDEYGFLDTSAPLTGRPDTSTKKGSSRKHESITPASGRWLRSQQNNDGELDQNASSSVTLRGSGPPSTSPAKRLTLPQRIPSIVNRATPRRQAGISANVRTSRPPFSVPEPSRSLQTRPGYRDASRSTPPAASPYFSNLALPNRQATQTPYPAGLQPFSRTPRAPPASPMLAPPQTTPGRMPWLTSFHAPDRQQNQSGSQISQRASGAFRQPGGYQRSADQGPSVNSFSFTTQPQIENVQMQRNSRVPYGNYGRRAAHR
ncbi:MAG: hypothetical protein Q9183_000242 [Haloplaca sp. 2 TL-2023]